MTIAARSVVKSTKAIVRRAGAGIAMLALGVAMAMGVAIMVVIVAHRTARSGSATIPPSGALRLHAPEAPFRAVNRPSSPQPGRVAADRASHCEAIRLKG